MVRTGTRDVSNGLVYAAYFAAFVFVLLPLGDLLVISWPLAPGRLEWRVGVVGTVAQILTFPSFALVAAAVLAATREHQVVLGVVSAAALLAALLALGMVGLFALDAVQARASLVPELKGTFTRQIAKSCMNLVFYGLLNGWVAVAGLRALARARAERRGRDGQGAKPAAGIVAARGASANAPSVSASPDA